MSAEQDQVFFKTFGIVMLILGVIGFAAFLGAHFLAEVGEPSGLRPEQMTLANKRTQPAYEVITSANAAQAQTASASKESSGGSEMSGEEVFKAVCHTCHVPGLMGAPKVSDTAEWKKRFSDQGIDKLYESAINGIGNMPPKGGKSSLTKKEMHAAVDYILKKAGVK